MACRCVTTSVAGFVQQLAVCCVARPFCEVRGVFERVYPPSPVCLDRQLTTEFEPGNAGRMEVHKATMTNLRRRGVDREQSPSKVDLLPRQAGDFIRTNAGEQTEREFRNQRIVGFEGGGHQSLALLDR